MQPSVSTPVSWHFEREPIPYALEIFESDPLAWVMA
jgi:hypothetical protein